MDANLIIFLVIGISVIGVGVFAFVFIGGDTNAQKAGIRDLMGGIDPDALSAVGEDAVDPFDLERIKQNTGRAKSVKKKEDLQAKMFKAGIFSAKERKKFNTMRVVCLVLFPIVIPLLIWLVVPKLQLVIMGLVMGVFAGLVYPTVKLDKKIEARQEDTLYYLPLVIEQVSIGVSSALDIGPCIANIVSMANERDSHNAVTEMLIHVEKLMRSGLNLEDALVEVGEASGMGEVKHAFMFLAQCAKHGGEISRQLQELADSVMVQRQTQVEAKITALPVKATGPLAMVFAGFFALLFAGLFVRLMGAFG
jgi:Flp pilus assembly protein TadB